MTEPTQPTDTGEAVNDEPSLDSIIEQYKPQPVAAAPAAPAAAVATAPVVSATVDPLNETQFGDYVKQVNNGQSVLSNQLQDVQTKLTQLEEKGAQLQIETDITDAVTRINEGLNLDPDLVRIHLEFVAQKKPGFKALWDNRKQNPAGYDAALKALSREIGSTHSVQTDPDLVANQVAIKQSQQSRSTDNAKEGSGNQLEDNLAGAKTPGDFDRAWQRMIGV